MVVINKRYETIRELETRGLIVPQHTAVHTISDGKPAYDGVVLGKVVIGDVVISGKPYTLVLRMCEVRPIALV